MDLGRMLAYIQKESSICCLKTMLKSVQLYSGTTASLFNGNYDY
jgi:hypothetical protein